MAYLSHEWLVATAHRPQVPCQPRGRIAGHCQEPLRCGAAPFGFLHFLHLGAPISRMVGHDGYMMDIWYIYIYIYIIYICVCMYDYICIYYVWYYMCVWYIYIYINGCMAWEMFTIGCTYFNCRCSLVFMDIETSKQWWLNGGWDVVG